MTASSAKRGDIPSLTGLRFFAAMTVVIGHALHSIRGYTDVDPFTSLISTLSGLGMTLFFVLSGFVIHYNYRETIQYGGVAGYWKFFVARFSRLYPLFFVLFFFELYYTGAVYRVLTGDIGTTNQILATLPYYLTLTQSWFYTIVDDSSLIYAYGRIGSISWSISTEWFFYVIYPIILVGLLWLPRTWMKLLAAVVLSAIMISAVWIVIKNTQVIDDYGLSRFGPPASLRENSQHSLFRWILYFSPYSRVSEFILGVLVCAIYLDLEKRPAAEREQRIGLVLTAASVLAIGVTHYLLFGANRPWRFLTNFHMLYGYAVPVALLIFCCARYRNVITGFLSSRPLVAVGEVSYSLYFLHILVIGRLLSTSVMTVTPGSIPQIWAAALTVCAIAIALSFVSYFLIEVPARSWFRRVLAENRNDAPAKPLPRLPVFASRTLVLSCVFLVPLAITVVRPPPKLLPPPAGTIEIVDATYGGSCGVAPGNVSKQLVESCSGTRQCNYVVNVRKLGDPAGGCAKDFQVQWRCSPEDPVQSARIDAEAGLGGKSVVLACPARTAKK